MRGISEKEHCFFPVPWMCYWEEVFAVAIEGLVKGIVHVVGNRGVCGKILLSGGCATERRPEVLLRFG